MGFGPIFMTCDSRFASALNWCNWHASQEGSCEGLRESLAEPIWVTYERRKEQHIVSQAALMQAALPGSSRYACLVTSIVFSIMNNCSHSGSNLPRPNWCASY